MRLFPSTRLPLTATAAIAATLAAASPAPAAGPTVERDPLYDLVTSKLDAGGTSYQYADARGTVAFVVDAIERVAEASGDKNATLVPPMAKAVLEATGLNSVEAFGSSVARLSDGSRRVISFVASKERGGLLTLWGGARRSTDLEGLAIVPEDAVAASVVTVDFGRLMPIVNEAARGIAGSVGTGAVSSAVKDIKKDSGLDVEKLLGSLGDEAGFFIRLDPERTATIPSADKASSTDDNPADDSAASDGESKSKSKPKSKKAPKTMTVPVPQFVIWVKTKDDTLADAITGALKKGKAETSEAELPTGLKGLAIQTPKNDFAIAPVVAKGFGRVFIATSAEVLNTAAAARDGGKTLATNADFKRLVPAAPDHADGVTYLSPRWAEELEKLWSQAEKMATKKDDRNGIAVAKTITALTMSPGGLLVRRYNDADGLLWVTVAGGAKK